MIGLGQGVPSSTPLALAVLAVAAAIAACAEVVSPTSVAVLTAVPPTSITAPPGTTVEPGPTVRVLGESRSPVEGVTVSFAVTAGNGSVANQSATTNVAGFASAGAWMIGTEAGVNAVTASVSGLRSVVFTATTAPGSVAQLVIVSGDEQGALPNTTLPEPLSVRVVDAFGNPISGATVTFTVTSGGGTIAGSPAVSNSLGIATSGSWRLGPEVSAQTVRAQSGSAQVTFTARGGDPCDSRFPLTVGATVNGRLTTDDCVIVGAYADLYSLPTVAEEGLRIFLSSPSFDALLKVATAGGVPVATNNRGGSANTNASIKLIAAAGTNTIIATSGPAAQTGPYSLSVITTSPLAVDCQDVFIQRGVTTQQSLATTDCRTFAEFLDDQFFVYIAAGTQITITQRSADFDTYLVLFEPATSGVNAPVATFNDNAPAACPPNQQTPCTNSQIVFVAPVDGYYVISASSRFADEVGSYSLTVN